MLHKRLLSLVVLSVFTAVIGHPGRSVDPSKGRVWPKPAHEVKKGGLYSILLKDFSFKVKGEDCKLLEQAIERCRESINSLDSIAKSLNSFEYSLNQPLHQRRKLQLIWIQLTEPCEEYPHTDMDESYNLTVNYRSKLRSASIWGIIRGLETFSQLFYLSDDYKEVLIETTQIVDYPHYPHRGLMLDTSRHYISMDNILKTLDAMSMNKMNVFHWHIVDDHSFPYQSQVLPELWENGAYHPVLVYSKEDIQNIIEFARVRGIRVMPEIDGPAHSNSWHASHSDIMINCSIYKTHNPIRKKTYDLLGKLFAELQELFPDQYFHLGADEVSSLCWKNNSELRGYMKRHNMRRARTLHKLYIQKTVSLLKPGTVPVMWEDAIKTGNLTRNAIVQVWKNHWKYTMVKLLRTGYKLILSSTWYLDYPKTRGPQFHDFYASDPRSRVRSFIKNQSLLNNVLGGEACLWSERVDDDSVIPSTWPRTSAVAEVLWSKTDGSYPPLEVEQRMEEHTCRMRRREIRAQPASSTGFCVDINNVADNDKLPLLSRIAEDDSAIPLQKADFEDWAAMISTFIRSSL